MISNLFLSDNKEKKVELFFLVLLSLIIGVIYVSHHFWAQHLWDDSEREYAPIALTGEADEAISYGPRINAANLGQWLVGNISLLEHKYDPATLPIANPLIMLPIVKVFGSIDKAIVFSDFLFPIFIFLMLYYFFRSIVIHKGFAMISATIFLFVPKVFIFSCG